jgi:hypothetical protein
MEASAIAGDGKGLIGSTGETKCVGEGIGKSTIA